MSSDQTISQTMLEFTAPFDLETCRQRLDSRHERFKFFAWDWQRRTHVSTQQTTPDTVKFTLELGPQSEKVINYTLTTYHGTRQEEMSQ